MPRRPGCLGSQPSQPRRVEHRVDADRLILGLAIGCTSPSPGRARRPPGSPSSTLGWRRSRRTPRPRRYGALRLHQQRRVGTYAMILGPDGQPSSRPAIRQVPAGLPYAPGIEAASTSGRDETTVIGGTPIRVLSETVVVPQGHVHGPGRPGPDDRAAHAGRHPGRAARRRAAGARGLIRVSGPCMPAGDGPHPRIAGEPADRVAPPARVRGRREPPSCGRR